MIVLRGPIWYPDSYSNNVRGISCALHALGQKVRLVDTPLENWKDFPFPIRKNVGDLVTELSQTEVNEPYHLIQHACAHLFNYDPDAEKNIGWTMFETDRIPPQWIIPCMAMDQIWNPTLWGARTFQRTGLKKQDVQVVPLGVDTSVFNPDTEPLKLKQTEGKKVFVSCFDWTERKNGDQLIVSFIRAFQGRKDVVLILKCYFKEAMNKTKEILNDRIGMIRKKIGILDTPQILIYDEMIPDEYVAHLYKAAHWNINISHGEGFSRTVLESMAVGCPAIVTNWGGSTDFCDASNSLPISDTQLGPVPPAQVETCGVLYANSAWAYVLEDSVIENLRYAEKICGTDTYKSIQDSAIARAKTYDWSNVAKLIVDLTNG